MIMNVYLKKSNIVDNWPTSPQSAHRLFRSRNLRANGRRKSDGNKTTLNYCDSSKDPSKKTLETLCIKNK